MKTKWISIKRLKMHEVDTTLRRMNRGENNWFRKSEIYAGIQKKSIETLIKQSGTLVLAYLIASSLRDGSDIALKVQSFEASVPAAYFLFVTSLGALVLALSFNHASAAISLHTSLAGRFYLPGFVTTAYEVLVDRNDSGLGLPSVISDFFREVLPVTKILVFLVSLSLFSALLPLFALFSFLIIEQNSLIGAEGIDIFQKAASYLGISISVISVLLIVFFHIPLPFKKKKRGIRWNFLISTPNLDTPKEIVERWLDDK